MMSQKDDSQVSQTARKSDFLFVEMVAKWFGLGYVSEILIDRENGGCVLQCILPQIKILFQ